MVQTFASGDVLEHVQLNNMIRALNGDGVISGFAVSQKGTGANMSVDVALGEAIISNIPESESGTTNVVIAASHATLYRKDLITYDASANTPAVIKGNNHAGGTSDPIYPPDIPVGDILLAIVKVDAAATTIVDGDITDCRIHISVLDIEMMASDDRLNSDDTVETTDMTSYTKMKDFAGVPHGVLAATLRIKFDLKLSAVGTNRAAYGRIYRNGVAVGTERVITADTNYATFSEDLAGWVGGDTIELWAKKGTGTFHGCYIKNFRAYGMYILDW